MRGALKRRLDGSRKGAKGEWGCMVEEGGNKWGHRGGDDDDEEEEEDEKCACQVVVCWSHVACSLHTRLMHSWITPAASHLHSTVRIHTWISLIVPDGSFLIIQVSLSSHLCSIPHTNFIFLTPVLYPSFQVLFPHTCTAKLHTSCPLQFQENSFTRLISALATYMYTFLTYPVCYNYSESC